MPAFAAQPGAFLLATIEKGTRRATVDGYLCTVGQVHVAARLPSLSKVFG